MNFLRDEITAWLNYYLVKTPQWNHWRWILNLPHDYNITPMKLPTMNLPHDEITHDEYRIYCTMKLPLTMKLPTMNLPHDEITHDEFIARWNYPRWIYRTMEITMNLSHDEITHDEFIARWNHPPWNDCDEIT